MSASTESRPGDTNNNLLAKILRRLNGIASPGDTNAQLLAKILNQFVGGGGGGGGASDFTDLGDVPASYAGAAGKEVFVNAGATALEFVGPYFTKVGTAYIGGDQTGDARGAAALDVQSARSVATQVASSTLTACVGSKNTASNYGSAFGYKNTASGYISSAFGYLNVVSGTLSSGFGFKNTASGAQTSVFGQLSTASAAYAVAIGRQCVSSGSASFTLGQGCQATALQSAAIGFQATARIANTTNIAGPQIIIKDSAEGLSESFKKFSGVNVVLSWPESDLKTVTDYVITLPSGCHFYPDECGVIVTSANTVTVQPTVRFGNSGTPAKFLAAAITTTAAVQFDRQRYQTLLSAAGEVTLSAGVTIAATATTMLGRFYIKGLLVEDE